MKQDNFQKVSDPIIGQRYHLSWANPACRWALLHIWEKDCIMVAEKSGKKLLARVEDLRELRKNQTV